MTQIDIDNIDPVLRRIIERAIPGDTCARKHQNALNRRKYLAIKIMEYIGRLNEQSPINIVQPGVAKDRV